MKTKPILYYTISLFVIMISLLSACGKTAEDLLDAELSTTEETTEEAVSSSTELSTGETLSGEQNTKTKVTIDGLSEDWENYPISTTDMKGDQEPGTPDFGEIRAFDNNNYFYLMAALNESGTTNHYDVLLDVNGGDYDFQVSFFPDRGEAYFAPFPVTAGMRPAEGVSSAQDQVIELKVPLSLVGSQPVLRFHLQTFLGDRSGDQVPDVQVQLTDESEEIALVQEPSQPQNSSGSSQDLCQGESALSIPGFTITLAGAEGEMLWKTPFVPWWVRTGPDGHVYAVTDGGDSIYELKPDGTLAVAFSCPGIPIETGIMASDGAFWFADRRGGTLYRVDPDGSIRIVAQNGNRNLEAGLDGSVYTLEDGMERIDPDGTRTLIANDLYGRKFAIGPNGEIVTLQGGSVIQVSEDGTITELAAGYGPEPWLTFGLDGLLYVTHWSGVDVIDLETGSVTPIPWLENAGISEAGNFAADGRLLMYHPNTDVYAVDLQEKTVEVYYQVTSNSWAMAISPNGEVYVAFGNGRPNGETTIYRVVDFSTLEPLLKVPYGEEMSMAFDSQGIGYIGVGDQQKGGAVLSFNPDALTFDDYQLTQCWPNTLAIDPQTDLPWWVECDRFESLNENGERVVMSGVPGSQNASLAITTEGEFYAVIFFNRDDPNTPFSHALYHWDAGTATWDEVADLTQSDPGISMSKLVACSDGGLYTVESLARENLPITRSSYNAVRRVEADGSLTLVGFDFSFDGQAVSCDFANNRILFTSGAGIFAVTMP